MSTTTTITATAPPSVLQPHHESSTKGVASPSIELSSLDNKASFDASELSAERKDRDKTRVLRYHYRHNRRHLHQRLRNGYPHHRTPAHFNGHQPRPRPDLLARIRLCSFSRMHPLAFGSVADVIGSKRMWLVGSGISCPLILACGLARTGNQFIIFRAILGLFVAMCLATSMSLVTASFPPGRRRNIAFAAMGVLYRCDR